MEPATGKAGPPYLSPRRCRRAWPVSDALADAEPWPRRSIGPAGRGPAATHARLAVPRCPDCALAEARPYSPNDIVPESKREEQVVSHTMTQRRPNPSPALKLPMCPRPPARRAAAPCPAQQHPRVRSSHALPPPERVVAVPLEAPSGEGDGRREKEMIEARSRFVDPAFFERPASPLLPQLRPSPGVVPLQGLLQRDLSLQRGSAWILNLAFS
ncbi:hypothetical protein SETIT_1G171500v2 [Setaria italica]|uniref:Uncharacterized protein n=1 Tax=Setaria italica TaxID=4555 RepID=A0A368PLL6_SETIT|nr:hypothetical protein SETIT_1G171500v2 [Setaria italica]